jgi:hypothetical protein
MLSSSLNYISLNPYFAATQKIVDGPSMKDWKEVDVVLVKT